MAIFKKIDDGDKKPKAASKPAAKPKMIPSSKGMKMALGVDSVQAGKKYAFTKEAVARRDSSKAAPKTVSTLKRTVKEVPTKRVPVSKLTRSVKTVSKKAPMESAKPKMQKTPWILKQTTGLDSMPSLEGKSKQYRDSVTMETYKKGGYRIK